MTRICDVMTPNPITCGSDATLQEIAQKMLDEDTGFIPLVENGCVCGVITDRDIAVRATAQGVDPTTTKAIDFATCGVICVLLSADVDEAIKVMERAKIRRLLVVDGNRPVGVVSLGDLAECTPKQAEEVLVEVSRSPRTLAHATRM